MTWTSPMTAVATSVFTAAQFNTFVRDNFNECPAAKAATPGSFFATAGTNSVVERTPNGNIIATEESTTSTSYTDLTTNGPAVTLATGSSAFVHIYSQLKNNTANVSTWVSFVISGSYTLAADDSLSLEFQPGSTNGFNRFGATFLITGITPGTSTFKLQYRVSSNTGSFALRRIAVMPI